MPILENAKKALRASKRKAAYNQVVRSRAKNAVDALRKNPSMETLSVAYQAIDMAVKRNLYQANKAARMKSQLAKLVKPTKLAARVVKKAKPTKKAKSTAKKATAKKTKPATKKSASTKKTTSAKKTTKKTTSPKKKAGKK
jgi:DNA-binding protein HU-beta